jgi:hypothetical protein
MNVALELANKKNRNGLFEIYVRTMMQEKRKE